MLITHDKISAEKLLNSLKKSYSTIAKAHEKICIISKFPDWKDEQSNNFYKLIDQKLSNLKNAALNIENFAIEYENSLKKLEG